MNPVRKTLQEFLNHLTLFRQIVIEKRVLHLQVVDEKFLVDSHFQRALEKLDQLTDRGELEWFHSQLVGLEAVSSKKDDLELRFNLDLYRLTFEEILREVREILG